MTAPSAWDPTLPVLAGLLERRETLRALLVHLTETEAVFHCTPETADGPLAVVMRQVREPFRLDDLLVEQVPEAERFLAVLGGAFSEFEVPVHTRVPTLVPCEVPEDGHEVRLRVRVTWSLPRQVHLHMPLLST